jgi:hypothetical protein
MYAARFAAAADDRCREMLRRLHGRAATMLMASALVFATTAVEPSGTRALM